MSQENTSQESHRTRSTLASAGISLESRAKYAEQVRDASKLLGSVLSRHFYMYLREITDHIPHESASEAFRELRSSFCHPITSKLSPVDGIPQDACSDLATHLEKMNEEKQVSFLYSILGSVMNRINDVARRYILQGCHEVVAETTIEALKSNSSIHGEYTSCESNGADELTNQIYRGRGAISARESILLMEEWIEGVRAKEIYDSSECIQILKWGATRLTQALEEARIDACLEDEVKLVAKTSCEWPIIVRASVPARAKVIENQLRCLNLGSLLPFESFYASVGSGRRVPINPGTMEDWLVNIFLPVYRLWLWSQNLDGDEFENEWGLQDDQDGIINYKSVESWRALVVDMGEGVKVLSVSEYRECCRHLPGPDMGSAEFWALAVVLRLLMKDELQCSKKAGFDIKGAPKEIRELFEFERSGAPASLHAQQFNKFLKFIEERLHNMLIPDYKTI